MIRIFQRYILSGLIFQSVIIAGGYATGRELVEFFLSRGPAAGLMGMLVTTLLLSMFLPIGFEFARVFRAYDYYSYVKKLMGRYWILFELGYAAALMLILAVIASGVGTVASEKLGVSANTASLVFMLLVGCIVYFGSKLIERILSFWSLLLYLVYGLMFYLVISQFGENIADSVTVIGDTAGAVRSGLLYAALQISLIPAVLFATRHFKARRHAVISGILAGPITMIPAFLMFFSMLAFYPQITSEPVPMAHVLDNLGVPVLTGLIQLVILGTFVETGAAMVHSVNERVAFVMQEHKREFKPIARSLLGFAAMVFSAYLATAIGIVELIGKGYVWLAYYFTTIFALPLVTVGVWKMVRHVRQADPVISKE
jgi:uncharacterized membrane protein YkvI